MNFQDVILNLNGYWGSRDCVLHQPYDIESGAGTFNPATFFRVLGPEPYRAAYVEPSRRPTDGRYGENPNRLQHYYQYQVILKPSPEDVQDQYLDSLKALGINPMKHDIRFVEDDWESPTLGAWGLGWEVWLDGMEITQFTYFQQVGGIDLAPVSVGSRDCVLHQPYDIESGAGTFNPATFFRVLGPEPYRAAYVEHLDQAPDAFWDEYHQLIGQKDMDTLIERVIPVYDKHMSHETIRRLIEMFETPFWQEWKQKMPAISREAGIVGSEWGAEMIQSDAFNAKLDALIQKHHLEGLNKK